MKIFLQIVSAFVVTLLLGSCAAKKNLTYFNDLPEKEREVLVVTNKTQPRIKPDDVLSIKVSTLNAEANTLFNQGVLSTTGIGSSPLSDGYKVDQNGDINFPVFGKLRMQDKTLEEAQAYLAEQLSREVKNPIVNIRFLNAQVTVLGEVGAPGVVNISERKTTILEALGKAGDITTTGRKDNVLLMRENGNQREIVRLDMNKKATINSPYFYLQQNDVVLVEPTARKERQVRGVPDGLNLVTLSLSLLGTILGLYLTIRSLK